MNQQRPLIQEARSFTVVRDHHFVMTEEDFPSGCYTVRGLNRIVGTGENKLGIKVTVPLHVPLCKSCDGEIVDAACVDCRLLHADLLQLTETRGDPFLGRL